ncbi:hypothetical protein Emed_000898 [Eimeria media]
MAPRSARAPPSATQQLPDARGAPEKLPPSPERFWGGPLEWFRRWTWGPHVQAQTLQREPSARQSSTNKEQALRQTTTPLRSNSSSSSSSTNTGGRLSFGLSGSRFSSGNVSASSSSSSSSVADPGRLRRSHQRPLTGCLPSRSSSANRSSSIIGKTISREKPAARPPCSATDSRGQQQNQRCEGQPQQQQQTHRAPLQLPQLQRRSKEQHCQKQQLDSFLTFAAPSPQNCQEKENDAAAARAASIAAAAADCLSSSSGDLPSELKAAAAAAISAAPAYVREEAKNSAEVNLCLSVHSRFVVFSQLNGKTVELKNREEVAASIHRLHCEYGIPLCRQFGFRYSFLAEQHPLHRKAGSVIRKPLNASKDLTSEAKLVDSRSRRRRSSSVSADGAPLKSNSCSGSSCSNNGSVSGGSRWWYCIRIRMRQLQKPEELLKLPTQLGIFFHELAHLKFMNHGIGFARLLASIFRSATLMGLFDPGLETELPSPWLWERVVFSSGGFVSDELLHQLLLADPKARAAAGAACDSARAAAPSDAVSPLKIPAAAALQQAGSTCTDGSTSPTTAASTPTQGGLAAATDAASVAAKPGKFSLTTSATSTPKAEEAGHTGNKQPEQTQQQEQRSQQRQNQQRPQRLQPQKILTAAVPRSSVSGSRSSALTARTATPRSLVERRSISSSISALGSKASISTCASSSVLSRGSTHAKPSPRPRATSLLNLQQQRPRTPRALNKKPTPRKTCTRRSSCSTFPSGGTNSTSTIRSSSTKPQQQRKRSGSVPGAQVGKRKATPRKRGEPVRRASIGAATVPVKPATSRAAACVPPLARVAAAAG